MKLKIEYLILVVVILALSMYLVLHKRDRLQYGLPELHKLMKKEITKIQISKQDTAVLLSRKGNVWQIVPEGYQAEGSQVENMLDVIEALTLTALVSESRNYDRYSLDEENKIEVKAWVGDKLSRVFQIGKAATTFRHTFVKLSDDPRVYQATGDFRNKFDLSVDNLRDKTVLAFDASEIREIHLSTGEQSIVFTRKQVHGEITSSQEEKSQSSQAPMEGPTWQSTDGKSGDESKLNRILTTLSNLRCERYLEDGKKEDLSDPICTIQLTGVKKYSLSIYEKIEANSNNYPATSSDNDYAFLLPSWQVNDILKAPEEFLEKTDEP